MTRHDDGFTLIEMLIAVALMGLMLSAISGSMILAFRTVSTQGQDVTDSAGAQLLVSYLVSDAQSADQVQPTNFTCDAGALLELRFAEADASVGGVVDVVYAMKASPSGGKELSRDAYALPTGATTCAGASSSHHVLVRDVDASGTTTACAPACDATARRVGLHVKAFSTSVQGSGGYSAYEFDVSGTRRAG